MAFTTGWSARAALTCIIFAATASALLAQKTPAESLRALQEGNRRFAADRSVPQPVGEGVRRTLARGQSPIAVVLCCADSRVPPEHVFNAGLGELFVVRVAGHSCDTETLASIEYAVDHLNVPLCVVLGHESCGAVRAAIAQVESLGKSTGDSAASEAVQQLLEHIEPAVRKAQARDLGGAELASACEEEHTQLTVAECLRRSPLLRRYAQVGRFQMVAARYHLQSGEVEWLPGRPMPADPQALVQPPVGTVTMNTPPHVALRMLQAGHRRFLSDGPQAGDLSGTRREQLTHGQHPLAIVLTCADSRVAPEHVFDAGLGELFVIRLAGNTLNDDVLASIEYAASHTGASLLVVMGHTRCGAISAAMENPKNQQLSPNVRALLTRLEPSIEQARRDSGPGRDLVELAVRANVQRVVAEARSRSPLLRELEKTGRFALLPTVYDVASGDLAWMKDTAEPSAMPAATPSGETKKAADDHGHHAPESTGHAKAEHAGGGHAAQDDGGHGTHQSTAKNPLDWSAVAVSGPPPEITDPQPTPETHDHAPQEQSHGHDNGVAAVHEPANHGAPAVHDHGEVSKAPSRWQEPTVIIGLAGVGSLLLAALLAMFKK